MVKRADDNISQKENCTVHNFSKVYTAFENTCIVGQEKLAEQDPHCFSVTQKSILTTH